MVERFGHGSDDGEPECLPQPDGRDVCLNDRIELHGLEPGIPGGNQGIRTQRSSDSLPAVVGMDHVAGVGHMASAAALVGVQFTGTEPKPKMHYG